MPSVDDRTVAMKFNNTDFEKNAGQTIGTLDKLKGSLDFSKTKGSADELGKSIGGLSKLKGGPDFSESKNSLNLLTSAVKNFTLKPMATTVEGISTKFLTMASIATTAIANITNRAVDMAITVGKSLTIDPVKSGFGEYEQNIKSIQTILSNTKADGTGLKEVTAALDELNVYADKTIYNFGEMTKNIGTFTAAGVDLDTSVEAIKGIANLGGLSGSSSEKVSSAMYQLSQAVASGTLKAQDWISVVNADMGGEIFQKSLFETGKALGTLQDVDIATTFDEWKAAGNNFKGSLEDGWITAEVLTTTLSGFTGDMSEAQLLAIGYTKEQAAEIIEMGIAANDATTQVKTLTQLMETLRESAGSGWAESFKIIVGDFDEAKKLFTEASNVFGGMLQNQAKRRNELLTDWKALGGRDDLIQGIRNAFVALGEVIKPIREAFQEIFPPMTAERLANLTKRFKDFTAALIPAPETIDRIKRIFRGLFAGLEIGIEVVKGVVSFFKSLFDQFVGPRVGSVLDFFAGLGDKLTRLNEVLVGGGAIRRFFDELPDRIVRFVKSLDFGDVLTKIGDKLEKFGKFVSDLFEGKSIGVPDVLAEGLQRVGDRFSFLVTWAQKLGDAWDWLTEKTIKIAGYIADFAKTLGRMFANLGDAIADAFKKENQDSFLDAFNVGIFGGILILFKKFVDNGFKIDFGSGLLEGMRDTLEALTGTLEAMQTKVRADAILKIAAAMLLLTGAIVILSLIDSGKLASSMTAMAVGFGQLIGEFAVLNTISSGPGGAAKLVALATGLLILSGAALVLSFAAKNLSGLDWNELAKGLTGVMGLMIAMASVIQPLALGGPGMIRAGLGMIGLAVAVTILAGALHIMSSLSWEDIIKGIAGVASGIAAMTIAFNTMPDHVFLKGLGFVAMAAGLVILAGAVALFGTLELKTLSQGLLGITSALIVLALAMNLFPKTMPLIGAGLMLVGAGLVLMGTAIALIGFMNWNTLLRGLAGMAGALIILAAAAHVMQGAIGGAFAIGIMAGAMVLLAGAVKTFSKMGWEELLKGLGALVVVLVALSLTAGALTALIPSLFTLGAALFLIGAGMALFGAGVLFVANGFLIIAQAGEAGVKVVLTALDGLIKAIPSLLVSFAKGIVDFALVILQAAPKIVAALGELIIQLLDFLIDAIPRMAATFLALVRAGLAVIVDAAPEVIAAGFTLLMTFLQGISDNISGIVKVVSDILVKFFQSMTENYTRISKAGFDFLLTFLKGLSDNISKVISAGTEIVTALIKGIAGAIISVNKAALDCIVAFIKGIGQSLKDIAKAAVGVVTTFLSTLDDNLLEIVNAGFEFVIAFINGLAESVKKYSPQLQAAGKNLAYEVLNGITFGLSGKLGGVVNKVKDVAGGMVSKFSNFLGINSPSKVFTELGGYVIDGLVLGLSNSAPALNQMDTLGSDITSRMQRSLAAINDGIGNMDDMNPTITPVLDLTNVESEASRIGGLLANNPLAADVSFQQATDISASQEAVDEQNAASTPTAPTVFELTQNNYSPKALSVGEVYRNTKSQITMVKEVLGVS